MHAFFADELKKHHADALSIAVIREYRMADIITEGNQVTIHTRFQAASISKMVFALSVLRLVAERKMSLDDDVSKYLGDVRLQGIDGRPAKATVRQILSHTAGFNVHGYAGYERGAKLPTTAQIISGEPPCNSPKVMQEYAPGEHWVYSGGGFMVLQQCVENVSDMSFADFMEETILLPLDMADSTFRQDITENIVCGYSADFAPDPEHITHGYSADSDPGLRGYNRMPEQAAAGLWTTAADLAKFGIHLQNILRGKAGIIPQTLMQEMIRPQHDDILDLENAVCKTGLGCYLKEIHGKAYWGHPGQNCGYESRANFSVENGNGFCAMVNSNAAASLIGTFQDLFLSRV